MGFLSEIIPETLPEVQAVKGFFDSLTLQKVIPPLILLAVGLVAVRLMLRLFEGLERKSWSGPPMPLPVGDEGAAVFYFAAFGRWAAGS